MGIEDAEAELREYRSFETDKNGEAHKELRRWLVAKRLGATCLLCYQRARNGTFGDNLKHSRKEAIALSRKCEGPNVLFY